MLEALTIFPYIYSNFMKYYSHQHPFKEEEIDPEKLISLPVATQHSKDLPASITYLSLPWLCIVLFLFFFCLWSFWPFITK